MKSSGNRIANAAVLVLALAGLVTASAGASGSGTPSCFGKKATITDSGTIVGDQEH